MKKKKLLNIPIITLVLSLVLAFGTIAYAEPAETTQDFEETMPDEMITTDDGIMIEGQFLTELSEYEDYDISEEDAEIEEIPMTFSTNPNIDSILDSNGKYNGYDVYYADEAAEYCISLIKDHVEAIDKSFIIAVQYSVSEVGSGSPYNYAAKVYDEEFTKAFNDSLFVDGKGGDYILYSMYGRPFYVTTSCKCYVSSTDPDLGVALVYATPGKAYYYTTASQEQEFTSKVQSVLSSLKLSGKSDYEKVCEIYDYICANVEYDYDNLNKSGYYTMYTAYAALCQGKAVCQGYANLFYYMCNEAGVPCRIVAGVGTTSTGSGAHAWNIVQLDGKWYHVDTTWGASYSQWYTGRYFFLQSTYNFVNGHNGTSHVMDYMTGIQYIDYTSSEFLSAYPISETADYCGNHDYVLVSSRKASCGITGYDVYKCSKCGETYEETYAALTHKYVVQSQTAATCTKSGTIVEECMYCGNKKTEMVAAQGHNYEVAEHVDAGCINDGYTVYICKVCGHEYTGDIVPSFGGHDYVLDSANSKEMTHTEDGYDTYVCSVCGETYQDTYESIPNHVYDEFSVFGEMSEKCGYDLTAECGICHDKISILSDLHNFEQYTYTDEEGVEHPDYKYCTYCGRVIDEDENLVGHIEVSNECESHDEETIESKEASCLNQGYDSFTRCKNCGEILSGEPNFKTATGHSWDTYETDATCTENGHRYTYCAICHELSEHQIISATGHILTTEYGTEPTCTEDGTTDKIYCTVCGTVEEEADVIPATGHTYFEETVDATCTEDGYYSGIYCEVCGYVDEEGYAIPATGHNFVTISKAVPKTCYTDGKEAYIVCENCGMVESDGATIPAGHELLYWHYSAPSEYEDGNIECWYCPNCDTFFLDEAATQAVSFEDIVLRSGSDEYDSTGTDSGSTDGTDTDNNANSSTGSETTSETGTQDSSDTSTRNNISLSGSSNTEDADSEAESGTGYAATDIITGTPTTVVTTTTTTTGDELADTDDTIISGTSSKTGDTNITMVILIIVIIAIAVIILTIAIRTKPGNKNPKQDEEPDDEYNDEQDDE